MTEELETRIARLERQTAGMITLKLSDYNELITRIYGVEQRMVGLERTVTFETSADEIYKRLRYVEKMFTKIGIRLFKDGISVNKKLASPPASHIVFSGDPRDWPAPAHPSYSPAIQEGTRIAPAQAAPASS